MKKLILLTFLMMAGLTATFAQGKFSGGLELGFPTGTAADFVGVGFGLSGRYEATIQDKLNWIATAGFVTYSGKDFTYVNPFTGQNQTISGGSSTLIPLQGGVKYYFQETDNGFYGSGELGLFIGTGTGSSSRFGFSPGIGYRTGHLDFSGRYNVVADFNTFGIRAAYIFGN